MSSYIICRRRRLLLALVSLIAFLCILYHLRSMQNDTKRSGPDRGPRLGILVPFRDRFDELITFVPYITSFLQNQSIRNFRILILNQSAKYRFNRGALANAGYMLAKDSCDYIAIHDVDLIPVNRNLSYAYPEAGPYHLASPEYHPNYNYEKYFGGILLINNEHFELVNGFSNRYFGWGLEDDEFYTRVKAARLPITRPTNLTTNTNDTFMHFHYSRRRDTFKSREQRDALKYRDRVTGLKDLRYSVTSQHNLTIDGQFDCTVYNIELFCDTKLTPWCLPLTTHVKQKGRAISKGRTTRIE